MLNDSQLWGITMMCNGGELSGASMMDSSWASLVKMFISSLVNFEPDIRTQLCGVSFACVYICSMVSSIIL